MTTLTRQRIKSELRFVFWVALISLGQTFLMCRSCTTDLYRYTLVSFFCFCLWIFLWKGNGYVTDLVDRRISWLEQPMKRLIVGIISTVGYTAAIIVAMMLVYERLIGFSFGSSFWPTIINTVVITIIISLFLHSREFLSNWKKLELDTVKLRNENLTSKYESLKSQLDPHFLFNSLNVLSSLVYQDADKSARFIKQLSEVYRYVLEVRNKELVPLEEELKFVESYLFLQQIRFGEKLKVENSLTGTEGLIPPLALQILVENSIKHNVISEDDPLTISLFREGDYMVVQNNLQKKIRVTEASTGIGLENIARRYEFLSNQKIAVAETPATFSVKLPLLSNNG